jgi:hypothetical protein
MLFYHVYGKFAYTTNLPTSATSCDLLRPPAASCDLLLSLTMYEHPFRLRGGGGDEALVDKMILTPEEKAQGGKKPKSETMFKSHLSKEQFKERLINAKLHKE